MTEATCSVDGCATFGPVRRGWCAKHYHRWYRTGDPLGKQPRERYATSHGYIRVRAPGHALAHPDEHYVYEHRLVLYDAIGPGTHPCHWCGDPITWDSRYPADADALCVDHLDNDKANNGRANLVPSCYRCNTKRATFAMHSVDRARRQSWRIAP